jgi:hypothetical protein
VFGNTKTTNDVSYGFSNSNSNAKMSTQQNTSRDATVSIKG